MQETNKLKVFESPEFGNLRTLEINGEPYFVGKDVAEMLGYAKPLNALAKHVGADDSLKRGLIDSMGRTQETILINESGLYSLILSSKLPKAKEFKHWVTSEVLPSLKGTNDVQTVAILPFPQKESAIVQDNVKVFNNSEFGSIRTIKGKGEALFCGKDVTDILGYRNGSRDIERHVDEEDRTIIPVFDGTQYRNTICINESGLYSLILSSKLPKAKEFKHWVTSEILPTIRKTGGYVDNDDLFINTYLPFADDQTKLLFHATLNVIKSQNRKIEADAPKVEFAEHVASDPYGMRVREFAKICCDNGIETGEKRLYKFLRENGFLDENNIPYQRYINQGYFKVKEVSTGMYKPTKAVTRITGKGQQYLLRKLKSQFCSA